MRKITILTILALTTMTAYAELQNVIVGGSLRIRGNWYSSASVADNLTARNPLFQGYLTNSFRPNTNPLAYIRYEAQPGRPAVLDTLFDWNDAGHNLKMVEQRTKLNVRADFTDNISAFIELDSYDVWGEDFRSNYITGIDGRANTADDIEIYQSYIEAKEMFGYPLTIRIGRQELKLGSGWLVAPNETAAFFYGTSFDGIRATYATDQFSIDTFATKLAERSPLEEDGDTDFYGIYASYLGIENITLDAYWLYLRDAAAHADTYNGPVGTWIEDLLGIDDYDVTNLHTFGLRGAGTFGAFDFEAETAYQMGNADSVGTTFANAAGPFGAASPYGPTNAKWDTFGANLVLGYTFDTTWSPRLFIGGTYFGGEDNRDIDFINWLGALVCPFWHAQPSVSFNRLFSSWEYSEFMENTDMSNGWIARAGISAKPTEKLALSLTAMHCQSLEAYESTWPVFFFLGERIAPLANFSFIGNDNSKDMGWEAELIATYTYSPDLTFEAGWSHLFAGDGLKDGDFSNGNGLLFNGGTSGDDADYVYFETKLTF